MILVTGGAGFIGANFILDWLADPNCDGVINLDALTYAGNFNSIKMLNEDHRHVFVKGDIGNPQLVRALLEKYKIRAIVNFAAETHVDRAIVDPTIFIKTNILGTFNLLQATLDYWKILKSSEKKDFRFLHISTDEVYGDLPIGSSSFLETGRFEPNNPYSASKAASEHLVHAWHHTYGLPTLGINSSNNYGPYQFPEKLVPLIISNALAGKQLPIYGDGLQIRDWLYVKDHVSAIRLVLNLGCVGQKYNVGGVGERANIEVVKIICSILDKLKPRSDKFSYASQITFVNDRLGHDRRYAVDSTKIRRELGWFAVESFETGIFKTVQWYLENQNWS
jgi:dTDP-glucose 4,6-dehydratase